LKELKEKQDRKRHSVNAAAKRWIFPVTATDGWEHGFKDVAVASRH